MQYDEDARIRKLIESGVIRHSFLDPFEGWGEWMHLIVRHPTGVAYEHQCGGLACYQHAVEGYLIPLPPPNTDQGKTVAELSRFFHPRGMCEGYGPPPLPAERRQMLEAIVQKIVFSKEGRDGRDYSMELRLDTDRLADIAEAWIPVITPDGPAVLVFHNCD